MYESLLFSASRAMVVVQTCHLGCVVYKNKRTSQHSNCYTEAGIYILFYNLYQDLRGFASLVLHCKPQSNISLGRWPSDLLFFARRQRQRQHLASMLFESGASQRPG